MKMESNDKNLYIKVDKKTQDIIRKVIRKLELEFQDADSESTYVKDYESNYLS